MNDPLAGIGTPVGAPQQQTPPPQSDPLANIGTPVGTSPTSSQPSGNQSPLDSHPVLSAINDVASLPENMNIGALKSLGSGVGGLLQILGKYGIVPVTGQQQAQAQTGNTTFDEPEANALKEAGDWIQQHTQLHGVGEHAGGAVELIGELLSPLGVEEGTAEAGRGLSFADRMTQQAKVAKFLGDHPKIAKLAAVGARAVHAALSTGAQTGAQTFVHTGGDTEAAAQAAGSGAVLGGVTAPVADAVSSFLTRRVPQIENIAGEEVPTLSSQRPGTGPRGDVTTRETPEIAAEQQAAAPRVFRNIAKRATNSALEEANQGRAIPGLITDPARLIDPPVEDGVTPVSVQGGNLQVGKHFPFTIRGTQAVEGTEGEIAQPAAKAPQAAFKPPKYTTSSAPKPTVEGIEGSTGEDLATSTPREPGRDVAKGGGDLVATDAETAQMHLSRLNDILDNPPQGMKPAQLKAIEISRDELQEQMGLYHAYQRTLPNFAPIDAARAAESVGNFGEAADQLQNAAQPIYQKIDEATDGEFNSVNRSRSAALKRGDFTQARDYESRIQRMIADTGAITPAERIQASKLWSQSMVLDGIHWAIEHAANVNERYASEVTGGRILSGTRLQNGLDRLIEDYGTDRLESVIGQDGMENLTRMADLLKQPPPEREFLRTLSMNIYHNLIHGKVGGTIGAVLGHHFGGFEGALAGSAGGAYAERAVLRLIATSPGAGQLFDYAVRNHVTPKVATALISTAILNEHQPQQKETPQ